MAHHVSLRLATVQDVPAIRAVAEAAWWDTYRGMLSDDAIEEALTSHYGDDPMAEALEAGQQWLLAEEEGALLGFCATEHFPEKHLVFLHKLYVDPRRHGTGAGKKLIQAAMRLQPTARAMQLLVNRANYKAQAFYLRQGMRMRQSVTVIASEDFIKEDFLMEILLSGEQEAETPTTEDVV